MDHDTTTVPDRSVGVPVPIADEYTARGWLGDIYHYTIVLAPAGSAGWRWSAWAALGRGAWGPEHRLTRIGEGLAVRYFSAREAAERACHHHAERDVRAPVRGTVETMHTHEGPYGQPRHVALVRTDDGRRMEVAAAHREIGERVLMRFEGFAGGAVWVAAPIPPRRCPGCWSYGWMQRNSVGQTDRAPDGHPCTHRWHDDAMLGGLPATGPTQGGD